MAVHCLITRVLQCQPFPASPYRRLLRVDGQILADIMRRCDAGSKFGLLPYPALSANTSQRLTTIKFILNALGGDVRALWTLHLDPHGLLHSQAQCHLRLK